MEELKKRIAAAPVLSNGSAQFGPELRRDILEYSSEQKAAGCSREEVAAALGMKRWTLDRWHQNESKVATVPAAFVEVPPMPRGRPPKTAKVEPDAAFEVTCPSGFEVRVPARFEARALRELISALEGR
jgi:hypothetical protein